MGVAVYKRKRRRGTVSLGNRRSFGALRQKNVITSILTDASIPVNVTWDQVTDSEGHRWPIHLKLGELKRWDVGGEFWTQRQFLSQPDGKGDYVPSIEGWTVRDGGKGNTLGNYEFYNGPVLPVDPTGSGAYFPLVSSSTNAELDAAGATAIALCKPTNPVANAAVFLGELYKDGLPSLVGAQTWKSRALTARNAGSEYLNVQFGWSPLVSDIRSFAYAAQHADQILGQFERDAGKIVRRRFHFPITETHEETLVSSSSAPFGPNGSALVSVTGELYRHRTTRIHQWFSGAFVYWFPVGSDSRLNMIRWAAEAKKLLGISLTPDVLWELAPWSWAVDWFSNTGNVLSNLSDFTTGGLIMRYGYVMETKTVTDTYTLSGYSKRISNAPSRPEECSMSFTTEVKRRRRANPFGFGVDWDSLSPFQLSILAALGMSQGRK